MAQQKVLTPLAQLTIASAGIAVGFTSGLTGSKANYLPVAYFFVQATPGNSGLIYVGLSGVTSTQFIAALAAGEGISVAASQIRGINGEMNLALFYANGSETSDTFNVSYEAVDKTVE